MTSTDLPKPLTLEETFGLQYAAGYIPRSLRKKITKSKHPPKNDLLLCLFDLLDEEDDADHDSKRWMESINCGGLTRVNNSTYDVLFCTCICTSWSDFISTAHDEMWYLLCTYQPTDIALHVNTKVCFAHTANMDKSVGWLDGLRMWFSLSAFGERFILFVTRLLLTSFRPPLQFPRKGTLQKELITQSACVFLTNSWTLGLSRSSDCVPQVWSEHQPGGGSLGTPLRA